MGESVVFIRIYKKCPITILHKVTIENLIDLEMIDFDVIIVMDFIYSCYTSVDRHLSSEASVS